MFIKCETRDCGSKRQFLLLNTDRITTVRPSWEDGYYDIYFELTELEARLFGSRPILFKADDLHSIAAQLNGVAGQN